MIILNYARFTFCDLGGQRFAFAHAKHLIQGGKLKIRGGQTLKIPFLLTLFRTRRGAHAVSTPIFLM